MNWEVSPPRDGNQEVQASPPINASDYWSPYENLSRQATTPTVQPAADTNRFRSNMTPTSPPNTRWNESSGVAPYQPQVNQPRFNSQTYSAQFRTAGNGPRPFEAPAPVTFTRPGDQQPAPTYYPPTGGMVREAPIVPAQQLPVGLPTNDRRMIAPDTAIPRNTNSLSYRAMFGGGDGNGPLPDSMRLADNTPGRTTDVAGRRRLFQPPQPVAPIAPVVPAPGTNPATPLDRPQPQQPGRPPQQPERRGILGGLLRGGDRPAQPAQPQVRLTSERFNGANETGPVSELFMPDKYTKNPASDDFMRIFNEPNTTNRITMFGPTEIPQASTRALQQILNRRDGELRPNTPEYDTVVAMMGGGYHTVQDNPHVSIETIAGRKCIVLSNENAQRDIRAWTMFVPTDGMRYLYPVTFEGARGEFNAVRNAFNQTKWRRTPDAVAPPRPAR